MSGGGAGCFQLDDLNEMLLNFTRALLSVFVGMVTESRHRHTTPSDLLLLSCHASIRLSVHKLQFLKRSSSAVNISTSVSYWCLSACVVLLPPAGHKCSESSVIKLNFITHPPLRSFQVKNETISF